MTNEPIKSLRDCLIVGENAVTSLSITQQLALIRANTALTKHQQPMLGDEFSKDFKYQSAHYTLKNEEYLLLFTDGLLEAKDEKNQAFSRRFIRILKQLNETNNSEAFKLAINEKLIEHCQNIGLKDDICLVIMKKN